MRPFLRGVTVVFGAGAFGGLLNTLCVWACGRYGVTDAIHVGIAPALTLPWLYQRLVWGGIWGLLFLLPVLPGRVFWRGVFFSIGPTLVQLLVIFPYHANKGMFGLELGTLTPLFVIVVNAVWGVAASVWLRIIEGR